jgi:hypothetical protein
MPQTKVVLQDRQILNEIFEENNTLLLVLNFKYKQKKCLGQFKHFFYYNPKVASHHVLKSNALAIATI